LSAWVIVIVGSVIWFVGQRIRRPRESRGLGFDRILSIVGLCIFAMGVYSGMKGPVAVGNIVVNPFSFAHSGQRASSEALLYATGNLQVSSYPAAGWHGASKEALKCIVINNGSRSLSSLTFRFVTKDHRTVDLRIRGPYPAKTTKKVLVTLPDTVLRSYFQAPGMNASQICAASL
jgi:hypothetical protein